MHTPNTFELPTQGFCERKPPKLEKPIFKVQSVLLLIYGWNCLQSTTGQIQESRNKT